MASRAVLMLAASLEALGCIETPTNLGPPRDPMEPTVGEADGGETISCTGEVSPRGIYFGVVEGSRATARTFEIRNTSSRSCSVRSVEVSSDPEGSFALSAPFTPATIAPDAALVLRVEARPERVFEASGLIEIQLEGDEAFEIELAMGDRPPSELRVVPEALDFGMALPGCDSQIRTVTLYNVGATEIGIEDVNVSDGDFHLLRLPSALVSPGASSALDLIYRPIEVGEQAGVLEIVAANADRTIVHQVRLTGRAEPGEPIVDVYQQFPLPLVDVLLVIDDGPSMADMTSIRPNLTALFDFLATEFDHHIAVTTADLDDEAGRFLPLAGSPNDRIIHAGTASASTVFLDRIAVGSEGSTVSRGLETARLALSDPLLTGHNAGFLRTEAPLAILLISDRDDRSPDSPEAYASFFRALAPPGQEWRIVVSAVVGEPPNGCSGPAGTAEPAPRYVETATQTQGAVQSICEESWWLQNLGGTGRGLRRSFSLSRDPVPGTIEVYVDGAPIPEVAANGTIHWTFNLSARSVAFSVVAVPPPGSEIRIEYLARCI